MHFIYHSKIQFNNENLHIVYIERERTIIDSLGFIKGYNFFQIFYSKRGLHLKRFDPSRAMLDMCLRWIYIGIYRHNQTNRLNDFLGSNLSIQF